MAAFPRAAALLAPLALLPALATAQQPAPAAPATAPTVISADSDAPAASSAAPAKAVVPATGYSYGLPTTQRAERPHTRAAAVRSNATGADALMPGFETLADGSTRVFVDLSKPALYDAKPGRSNLTVVLKGTRVDRRNNQNPLVTVHFNTPVTSARLTPHGRDLWLVVDLRANVQPTAAMDPKKDGGATLHLDFPKGDYLPSDDAPPATAGSAPPEAAKSAPPAARPSAATKAARSAAPAAP